MVKAYPVAKRTRTVYHIVTGDKTRFGLCQYSTTRKKEAIAYANQMARQIKSPVYVVDEALADIVDRLTYMSRETAGVLYYTF